MDEEQQAAAYQSEATETETQTEAAETVTTQETAAPEGFTVKYNKEDRFVGKDEAPTWIQKGLNYDKVHERAQQLETQTKYLEKRARQEGFTDVNAYLEAIDAFEQQQQIDRESQRMGVDPETYAQYFQPVNQELSQLKTQLQTYESQLTERQQQDESNAKWGALYSEFPSLVESSQAFNNGESPEWFNDAMKGFVARGYDPVDAYRLSHADTINRQKEQEVLARVTGRDGKQVLPSVDSPNNVQFDPSNMSDEQIKAISERVQRGERITF